MTSYVMGGWLIIEEARFQPAAATACFANVG
jgi:hypothetical protein